MPTPTGRDNSGTLFNNIMKKQKLRRDLHLAKYLGEHASVISEIRNGKRPLNDVLLVRICEKTGISIKSARAQIAQTE